MQSIILPRTTVPLTTQNRQSNVSAATNASLMTQVLQSNFLTDAPEVHSLSSQVVDLTTPTPPKRKVKAKLNTIFEGELLDEAEAHLLNLILDRPVLFDYKIPVAERNPVSLSHGWLEVHRLMKEWICEKTGDDTKITLDVLKDTWMNIRTAYMRYKSTKKLPSGSSPSKKNVDMKHIDLLQRYDYVSDRRRTISTMDDDYDDEYAEERLKNCEPPKKKGQTNTDEFLLVAKKVLNTVSNKMEAASKEKPAESSVSSSRHFVESLVCDLDMLRGQRLSSAKMRISQIIHEEMSMQME